MSEQNDAGYTQDNCTECGTPENWRRAMTELKSKHLWPVFDSFDLRHNDTDTDEEGNEFSISHTPDWVVAAMLEDLRALEAENECLRAMLPSAEVRDGIRKLWNLQSGQPILSRIVVGEWLDSLESEATQ